MACLFHKWDDCKCVKCGKQRNEGHKWNKESGVFRLCSVCGEHFFLTNVFTPTEWAEIRKSSQDYKVILSQEPGLDSYTAATIQLLSQLDGTGYAKLSALRGFYEPLCMVTKTETLSSFTLLPLLAEKLAVLFDAPLSKT